MLKNSDFRESFLTAKRCAESTAPADSLSLGFRVWGLGFRVWGLGHRVQGLGFGVWGLGFGV